MKTNFVKHLHQFANRTKKQKSVGSVDALLLTGSVNFKVGNGTTIIVDVKIKTMKKHKCNAIQSGQWIVFTCPQCSYVRWWNQKTDQMVITEGEDPTVLHEGQFVNPLFVINPN
jgi:predicted nucleic-acid-binding Zn-ribbon protein